MLKPIYGQERMGVRRKDIVGRLALFDDMAIYFHPAIDASHTADPTKSKTLAGKEKNIMYTATKDRKMLKSSTCYLPIKTILFFLRQPHDVALAVLELTIQNRLFQLMEIQPFLHSNLPHPQNPFLSIKSHSTGGCKGRWVIV